MDSWLRFSILTLWMKYLSKWINFKSFYGILIYQVLLFRVSMGLVHDFSTKISVFLISQQAPKKSLNRFCLVLILCNLRAICFTAAFNFFNNQKICKNCDLIKPNRIILVNSLKFESYFNVGCPLKIWTEKL